jgi:hypothetical protein
MYSNSDTLTEVFPIVNNVSSTFCAKALFPMTKAKMINKMRVDIIKIFLLKNCFMVSTTIQHL